MLMAMSAQLALKIVSAAHQAQNANNAHKIFKSNKEQEHAFKKVGSQFGLLSYWFY